MLEYETAVLLDYLYEMFCYQYPKVIFVCFINYTYQSITGIEPVIALNWVACQLVIALGLTLQYYNQVNLRGWISLLFIVVWFLRLGGFYFVYRIVADFADKRYEEMLKNTPLNRHIFFLLQYLFQSIAVMFIGCPLYFVFRRYKDQAFHGLLEWNFIVMSAICIVAWIGQALADKQL